MLLLLSDISGGGHSGSGCCGSGSSRSCGCPRLYRCLHLLEVEHVLPFVWRFACFSVRRVLPCLRLRLRLHLCLRLRVCLRLCSRLRLRLRLLSLLRLRHLLLLLEVPSLIRSLLRLHMR